MILGRSATLWQGYGHESNTWEPDKHLQHAAELVQGYWEATKLFEQHGAGGGSQGNRDKLQRESWKPGTESLRTSGRQVQTPSRKTL